MSRIKQLQSAENISDIARLLGYKTSALSYILYKISNEEKYKTFLIPKKYGGFREIQSPCKQLKTLQRRLAWLLSEIAEEEIYHSNISALSHGFRKNHSIVTNASQHKRKRFVFNIDLKDFFPSFNFGRVRGFFIHDKNFKINEKIATIISQIACFENKLPQGSPCSPIISNLIGNILDIRLVSLAKRSRCMYSRYADDITFSTNSSIFPHSIAYRDENGVWCIGVELMKIIIRTGFFINNDKTSMQYKDSRQIVTGLIVNKMVGIKKEYYKEARAQCYELYNKGEYYHKICTNVGSVENRKGTINQLHGKIDFIYSVKRENDKDKSGQRRYNPNGITTLYRDFLLFHYFFNNEKPLIICEGKTDPEYLKAAIRSESLESTKGYILDNNNEYSVHFLNMSRCFLDTFSIATGTSGIEALIKMYANSYKKYKIKKTNQNPVICILDNDKGAKEINNLIKKQLGEDVEKNKSKPIRYFENLFILFISPVSNTAIENLFPKRVLDTILDGKTFNKENNFDTNISYGKKVFVDSVIKPSYKTIDFSKFDALFININKIISACKSTNENIF